MRSLRTALSLPATWVGVGGGALVTLGEVARVGGKADGGWAALYSHVIGEPAIVPLVIAGGVLLVVAWLLLWEQRERLGTAGLLTVAGLWSVPLWLLPPVLSTDAQAYADLGWMIVHGADPYTTGLGTTGSPFAIARVWQGTTSVYPAGALWLYGRVVALVGVESWWTVAAMRMLVALGFACLVWALPRLAAALHISPRTAIWLGIVNPLVLIHAIGGEHTDILMVGLVAVALAVALLPFGWWTGAVVVGLAASVKQPALLAAAVIPAMATLGTARRGLSPSTTSLMRRAGSIAGATVVAGATFWAVSASTGLGLGWMGATGDPQRTATIAPSYLLTTVVSTVSGAGRQGTLATLATMTTAGQVVAALVVVLSAVRWLVPRDEVRRPVPDAHAAILWLTTASFAWALGFGAFREWYLIFGLALLGLARPGRRPFAAVWLTGLCLIYGPLREYGGWAIVPAFWLAVAGGTALSAAFALQWIVRQEADPVHGTPAGVRAPSVGPAMAMAVARHEDSSARWAEREDARSPGR